MNNSDWKTHLGGKDELPVIYKTKEIGFITVPEGTVGEHFIQDFFGKQEFKVEPGIYPVIEKRILGVSNSSVYITLAETEIKTSEIYALNPTYNLPEKRNENIKDFSFSFNTKVMTESTEKLFDYDFTITDKTFIERQKSDIETQEKIRERVRNIKSNLRGVENTSPNNEENNTHTSPSIDWKTIRGKGEQLSTSTEAKPIEEIIKTMDEIASNIKSSGTIRR